MMLKPLIIAAAGLSAATAFLLPPELSESAADLISAIPMGHPAISHAAEGQLMTLDCPGCPMSVRDSDGNVHVYNNRPNVLELSFDIDHLPTNDRLMLNGFELYPNPDPVHSSLVAPQRPTPPEEVRGKNGPKFTRSENVVVPELGFGLEGHPLATDDAEGFQLMELNLQITQVGGQIIDGIPGVNIRLIKAPDGALVVGWIKQTEPTDLSEAPQEDCDSILCRWKAAVADQLRRMKGHKCGKMGQMGGHRHGRPGQKNTIEIHEHSWEQLFKSFKSHILWPVLVGIVAGVSVSIIVITISTTLVGLWRVFVRGQSFFPRRRRHASHIHKSAHREAALVADEKAGLMAAQEVPYADEENKSSDV